MIARHTTTEKAQLSFVIKVIWSLPHAYELYSATFGCILLEADILCMDFFNVFELNHLGILYKKIYRSEVSLSGDG